MSGEATATSQLASAVTISEVKTRSDRAEFLASPRRVRHGDRRWVEPLRTEQTRFLSPRHPFYDQGRGAEAAFFLARDGRGRTIGRIAAIANHLHDEHARARDPSAANEGFFGFFDAIDDVSVAQALVGAVEDWLRPRGYQVMIGPASPAHNYEYGVLMEGFDAPHRFMLAHNPAYYPSLLEACGLSKVKDLYALTFDLDDPKVLAIVEQHVARFTTIWERRYGSVRIRPVELRRWDEEVRLAVDLINRSLGDNWGYSPMTDGELRELGQTLRYIIDPGLVLFAEHDGSPVGVTLAVPELNEVMRSLHLRLGFVELLELLVRTRLHRFSATRVVALGVARDLPMVGVGPLLFLELIKRIRQQRFRYLDASWILEDNEALLRPLRRFGGVIDRTYRMYQKAL